ncbi:DEAD/DEAH box helicase [Cellulomonas soli]|uniref:Putative ATP-dependent RNA helicase n=1 Tax=Cellulomonas soli TaxID=931535 RepID=A0A512PDP4_9CELL|nr:DEAD/DEAH box helicase [Cellulomonas soli]NYI60105.1 superfamily II DNA/RNA helicase [Cellulomonas soli]GEP69242.1 putative ATP-dependent RNA helicase [Cellulomonas soli]
MTTFTDLGVPASLVRTLADQGIEAPFPIQTATLPDSLGGTDVLGRGRTGSGKTLAFALPIVTRLAASATKQAVRRPRGLILAPTRELATQIDATVAPLARTLGLSTTTIFGGVSQSRQVSALKGGIDIVVACPGRLEDLLKQGVLNLDQIEITVLDEADHMADLGFLPVVKRILDRTPKRGQRMLFSATLDNGVDVLVKRYLTNPVEHSVDSAQSPVSTMTHHVLELRDAEAKKRVIAELAGGTGRRVLFTRTKHHAKKLAKQLTAEGIPAVDLHGNLGQGARERNLEAFSSGAVNVLVATDIAARGIHVDDVSLVVHVDPPAEHKAYLHRSGRTARAGSGGDVVTLVLPEERGDVRALTRAAKITAQPKSVVPGDATVTRLAGPQMPRVTPSPSAQPAPAGRTSGGSPRGGSRGSGSPRGTSAPRGGSARGAGTSRGAGAGRAGGPARATTTAWSTSTPGHGTRPSGPSSSTSTGSWGGTVGEHAGAAGDRPARGRRRGGRGRAQRPAGGPSGS